MKNQLWKVFVTLSVSGAAVLAQGFFEERTAVAQQNGQQGQKDDGQKNQKDDGQKNQKNDGQQGQKNNGQQNQNNNGQRGQKGQNNEGQRGQNNEGQRGQQRQNEDDEKNERAISIKRLPTAIKRALKDLKVGQITSIEKKQDETRCDCLRNRPAHRQARNRAETEFKR